MYRAHCAVIFAIAQFSCLRCSVQCESTAPPKFSDIFPKRLRIFSPNFTCLLHVPMLQMLQIFIQLPATLTKLCRIKRDSQVYIICSKCPPSAKTHRLRGKCQKSLGDFFLQTVHGDWNLSNANWAHLHLTKLCDVIDHVNIGIAIFTRHEWYEPCGPCDVECVHWVDGICGSGQSGTVKNGGVGNAGVDISARYGKGGNCGNGQCGTIVARVDNAGGKKSLTLCALIIS